MAPSNDSQSGTVENYSPEETDDGTYGPTPPAEASTDEPVDESAPQPADEVEAEAEAPHAADGDVPLDETAVEHSTSDEASAATEDDSMSGSEPDADSSAGQEDGSASTSAPAAGSDVRDFVTPLLADLQAISQRSSAKANDVSASQRRAAANVHDQMIRQMLDQISATGTDGSSMQLFKSRDAETTQSLPARWYAEA